MDTGHGGEDRRSGHLFLHDNRLHITRSDVIPHNKIPARLTKQANLMIMVMTGMEKLQNCKRSHPELTQLYALENVGDDLENDPLPLVNQFFLTLVCDLLVDALFPAEHLDHADDVHDLGHSLNTPVRLQKKNSVMR